MIVSLLFFTLVFGTLLVFYINNKKLLSPTLILFAGFTVSAFSILINRDFFGRDISLNTYLIIIVSLIAWGVGEILSKLAYTKINKPIFSFEPKYKILPSNRILFVSCIIICGVAISEYYRFTNIGKLIGGDNFLLNYGLIRKYVVQEQNSGAQSSMFAATRTVVAMITLAKTLTYFFIVLFFFNKFFHGVKKYIYLFPVLFYLPILFFSTSRSTFLELFSFVFLTMLLIKFQSKGWGKDSFKILRKMTIPLLVLIIGFYSIGFVRSNGIGPLISIEMFNTLSKYFGSSIYGLDVLINSKIPQSRYLAEQTIPILYSILEKFGFAFEKLPLHSEFFDIGNGADTSNIYTALRKPIIDFGILGMLCTRVCMGFIYGLIFRYYSNNLNNPYSIGTYVIFPILYWPIMYYIFVDLFNYFFQFSFIETLVTLVFLNRLIVRRSLVHNSDI